MFIHKKIQRANQPSIVCFSKNRPISWMFRIFSQPSYKVTVGCELETVTSKILLDRELGLFHAVVRGAFHLERTQIDRSPRQSNSGAKERLPSTLLEESESSICRYRAVTNIIAPVYVFYA